MCGAIVCAALASGDAGDAARARQTPSSPDGFEFAEQPTRRGVEALAFSPDGAVLATSYEGVVTLWDAETGLEVRTFEPPSRRDASNVPSGVQPTPSQHFKGLAFDPAGRYVAATALNIRNWDSWNAASRAAPPNVWDARTGRDLSDVEWRYDAALARAVGVGFPFQAHEPELWQFAGDPESLSRLLAYRGPAQFFHRKGTLGAVVTKDPSASGPETIEVVDLASGQVRWRRVMPRGQDRFSPGLLGITFSPDERWMIATGFASGPQVWDLQTGQRVETSKSFELQRWPFIEFAPDGKRVILPGPEGICAFSTSDWSVVSCLQHTSDSDAFNVVAVSPDGRRVAAGHSVGVVHVWDVESGRELRRIDVRGARPVTSVAVSPDGQWLSAGTDRDWYDDNGGSVVLWPLRGEGVARGMRWLWNDEDAVIQSIAFSADSRRLVAASLGDVRTGRSSGLIRGQLSLCELPACDDVARLLDGDRRVRWELPEAAAEGAVFTPDGKSLIAAVIGLGVSSDDDSGVSEFIPYSRLVFYDLSALAAASPSPISPEAASMFLPDVPDVRPRELRVVRPRTRYRGLPPEVDDYSTFGALALGAGGRVAAAYDGPPYHGRPVDLWGATTGRWLRSLGTGKEGAPVSRGSPVSLAGSRSVPTGDGSRRPDGMLTKAVSSRSGTRQPASSRALSIATLPRPIPRRPTPCGRRGHTPWRFILTGGGSSPRNAEASCGSPRGARGSPCGTLRGRRQAHRQTRLRVGRSRRAADAWSSSHSMGMAAGSRPWARAGSRFETPARARCC